MNSFLEDIENSIFSKRYPMREGFVFTSILPGEKNKETIVIKTPRDIPCSSPCINGSYRSLEEHIEYINYHKIKNALIISKNIDFIVQCPTLKHLWIVPADSAGDGFDYSPLYKLPEIKSLQCSTVYGEKEEYSTYIDCSKLNNIEDIHVLNSKYQNFNTVKTLKSLGLTGYKETDLSNSFDSPILDTLSIFQSKIKSLDGIQKSSKMQCLYLYYNRSLQDISSLIRVKNTLKALRIDCCPKINDFSVLGKLENLEFLELTGSNILPNLSFLKTMPNLKTFLFDMNVEDGDISPCLNLSYVYSRKNRKHYNLKDEDLPKGAYVRGNETIEEWRRLI